MKLILLSAMFIFLAVGGLNGIGGFGMGASVIVLILGTCLVVYLPGAFRARDKPDGKL
ncbi:MAG TPA: hypothetical protein VN893_24400 [Bryobacteraceae bacterium]|nr:hypothetical protein [Bryobacteraceae bacterium]